jgi:hypothetical protein
MVVAIPKTLVRSRVPWWYRKEALDALETWVNTLIAPRPYTVRYGVKEGSSVDFGSREIVVDPVGGSAHIGGARLLPVKWGRQRVRTLATLQWLFSRKHARHESFHVLFTQPCACAPIVHWLLNVLEDERIELQARWYYPPAWADFLAYSRLLERHWPLPPLESTSREDVLLNACLFSRWDYKRPRGTASRYLFHSEPEEQFWLQEIRPLVQEAWRAPDTLRVREIALEILRKIGVPQSSLPEDHVLIEVPDGTGLLGSRGSFDAPLAILGGYASNAKATASADPVTGEEDERHGIVTLEEEEGPPSELSAPAELYLLPSDWLEQEVAGEKNALLRALVVPTPEQDEDDEPVGSEFSVEAFVESRGDRPFRTLSEDAPEHGGLAIILLLDMTTSNGGWPGSGIDADGKLVPSFADPRHRMTSIRPAVMVFELVCPRAGIPLCIGHVGDGGNLEHLPGSPERSKPGEPVTWIRTWQTPRDNEASRYAIAGLYGKYGSERMSPALRAAGRLFDERSEKTKLLLFLCDGEPTDEGSGRRGAARVRAAVEELRRKGILVYAPYVGNQSQIDLVQEIFGVDETIAANPRADLYKRLGRLLLRYAGRS